MWWQSIFDFQWATRIATTLTTLIFCCWEARISIHPDSCMARGKLRTGGERGIQLTSLRIAGIAKPGRSRSTILVKATINDRITNKWVRVPSRKLHLKVQVPTFWIPKVLMSRVFQDFPYTLCCRISASRRACVYRLLLPQKQKFWEHINLQRKKKLGKIFLHYNLPFRTTSSPLLWALKLDFRRSSPELVILTPPAVKTSCTSLVIIICQLQQLLRHHSPAFLSSLLIMIIGQLTKQPLDHDQPTDEMA